MDISTDMGMDCTTIYRLYLSPNYRIILGRKQICARRTPTIQKIFPKERKFKEKKIVKALVALLSIIVIAVLVVRTEPPSITASAHATNSKAVQEPVKTKMDTNPSEAPKAPEPPKIEPEQAPIPARVLTQPQQWMQAAGIPESDWHYVDCIISGCGVISPEGNWDGTQKWNSAGSGAYGLCQSLPANKMAAAGADWETNPVTQLKWCATHAANYGGWKQAWEFRQCVGSCYSTYAKYNVAKDHTWW